MAKGDKGAGGAGSLTSPRNDGVFTGGRGQDNVYNNGGRPIASPGRGDGMFTGGRGTGGYNNGGRPAAQPVNGVNPIGPGMIPSPGRGDGVYNNGGRGPVNPYNGGTSGDGVYNNGGRPGGPVPQVANPMQAQSPFGAGVPMLGQGAQGMGAPSAGVYQNPSNPQANTWQRVGGGAQQPGAMGGQAAMHAQAQSGVTPTGGFTGSNNPSPYAMGALNDPAAMAAARQNMMGGMPQGPQRAFDPSRQSFADQASYDAARQASMGGRPFGANVPMLGNGSQPFGPNVPMQQQPYNGGGGWGMDPARMQQLQQLFRDQGY